MMENNDKMILSEQPIGKEYQIPELVDLNSIGEALGLLPCRSGSGDIASCGSGSAGPD
jgi:hypothetical protein